MSLSDLVAVNISSSTVTPTKQGFGTPMLAAYHKQNTDRVRFYSSPAGAQGGWLHSDRTHLGHLARAVSSLRAEPCADQRSARAPSSCNDTGYCADSL